MPRARTNPPDAEPQAAPSGLQWTVAIFGMLVVGTVVSTALYGPAEKSERAFRLLHWWKRAPESAPEESTPPGRRRQRH